MFGKRNLSAVQTPTKVRTPVKLKPVEKVVGPASIPAAPAAATMKLGSQAGKAPATGSSGQRTLRDGDFPWKRDPAAVACSFALGHLAGNLAKRLEIDRQVHANTHVAAAGAIAGFAAQCTLFETFKPVMGENIDVVTTAAGNRYWFGDQINFMLVPRTEADAETRVWSQVTGAAIAVGLPIERMPEVAKMFAHVADTIGGDFEGLPSVPANERPHAPAGALLKAVWPFAMTCFSGKPPGADRDFGAVPRRWWSAIAAHAAARTIIDTKDAIRSDLALKILMETAIYTSKLDRTGVKG